LAFINQIAIREGDKSMMEAKIYGLFSMEKLPRQRGWRLRLTMQDSLHQGQKPLAQAELTAILRTVVEDGGAMVNSASCGQIDVEVSTGDAIGHIFRTLTVLMHDPSLEPKEAQQPNESGDQGPEGDGDPRPAEDRTE